MEVRRSGRTRTENKRYSGSDWEKPKTLKKPKKLLSKPKELSTAAAAAPEEEPAAAASTLPAAPPPTASSTSETVTKDSAAKGDDDSASDDDHTEDGPLSEEKMVRIVKKLYTDIKFPAAYAGIQSMRRSLLSQKNLKIPERIISKALNDFPEYIKNLPRITRYPRSHYDVSALGQLWQVREKCQVCVLLPILRPQADLAFVGVRRNWNGFKGWLLCIDCFSVEYFQHSACSLCSTFNFSQHRLFTRPFKDHRADKILKLFDDCVQEAG